MEFLRRRRRLILGVAAGAAGAAAAFYWWTGYHHTKLQQQRSMEMELSAILRGAAVHQGTGSGAAGDSTDGAGDGGGDTDADDCGSPDLDESLDSHFNYIQKVSAPQELSNLLPRIQATLFKLTDVTLVKQLYQQQQQQQQQQQDGHSVVGGGGNAVQAQLRLLARLCFGRTVAAAFLLPLIDLSVRTKLNIIGRHLFLQEKFSKLRQPSAPAARMRLPPRLTAAAVETFLACEHLADRGCSWLVEQAMSAADRVLEGTPMDTNVTPEQLVEMVQAMATHLGQAVTAAAATSATGCAWVDMVAGASSAPPAVGADATATSGSAEAYRRALANAAMVEELESELRRVLCNYRFGEALHAAVSQCLCTCAVHIHATFISQAAAAVSSTQQQQHHHHQQQQPHGTPPAEPAPAGDAAPKAVPVPPPQVDRNPHHQTQAQGQDQTQESGQEHTRQQQAHVISPFSTASREECSKPSSSSSSSAAAEGGSQRGGSGVEDPLRSGTDKVREEATMAPPVAGTTEAATSPRPPGAPSPRRSGGSGSSGGGAQSVSRAASLAAAAVAAMQPRPLARCLKAVQGACDPLFVDAREVSARIACLPPVMSLCAVAFAAPLEL